MTGARLGALALPAGLPESKSAIRVRTLAIAKAGGSKNSAACEYVVQ